MDRVFGITHGAQVIRCRCGATDEVAATGAAGTPMPPVVISKLFRRKGWRVGATPRKDSCTACSRRASTHPPTEEKPMRGHTAAQAEAMTKEPRPPMPGASETPPRVMGREDRQIVFAKLAEVYLGEDKGYAADWNDQRVSRDLNCPRAWVVEVREQFFGPVKAEQSPEVIALADKLVGLEAELTRLALAEGQLTKQLRGALTELEEVKAGTVAAGKGLTDARAELRKLTGRA